MSYVRRTCKRCGCEFLVIKSQLKHGRGKCCSHSCAAFYSSINRNQKGSNNNNWRGGSSNTERKRRYRNSNPEKHKAHIQLNRAIRLGIVKRKPCVVCGLVKVEGHHKDYSQPLKVVWLCKTHHLKVHKGKF